MSHFGLQARWWRIAISVYNVMICGRIILLIITKYIAYYHIAELYAHASIVSTDIMWGLKDVSNILSKTLKSQLCGSLLVFGLQLACNTFHGALSRWTRNGHHYFCHSLAIFAVMGVAHFTSGAHFGLPSPTVGSIFIIFIIFEFTNKTSHY